MDISQAFADLNSRYADAVNSHDVPGWAALFSEDAVLVPAGQPTVIGRKGIQEWGEVATKVWNHLELQQGRCSADGNVVWEQGTWAGNINLPDGQTMDVTGNFLVVAEKEGPALRIKADTWNVNPPPQWPAAWNERAAEATRPVILGTTLVTGMRQGTVLHEFLGGLPL